MTSPPQPAGPSRSQPPPGPTLRKLQIKRPIGLTWEEQGPIDYMLSGTATERRPFAFTLSLSVGLLVKIDIP